MEPGVHGVGTHSPRSAGRSHSQDSEGRYCLNDLHKAAGGEPKHRPNYFLDRVETDDLRYELKREYDEKAGIPAIRSVQGLGTYVVKELVYAYAMWISAKFHLQVIRAYDQLVTAPAAPVLANFGNPANPTACRRASTCFLWMSGTQEVHSRSPRGAPKGAAQGCYVLCSFRGISRMP